MSGEWSLYRRVVCGHVYGVASVSIAYVHLGSLHL